MALYDLAIDDELIPFELASSPGRTFFENAGESSRRGLELSAFVPIVEGLTANFAYTLADFEFDDFVTDDGDDFSGNATPAAPEQIANLALRYTHDAGWYADLDTLWVDDLFADNANSVKVPSYTVTDLRIGGDLAFGRVTVSPFLGVSNLFDES